MSARLATLAAVTTLVPATAAQAVETLGLLPTRTPVTAPPPLLPGATSVQTTTELHVPINGHVHSRELVVVGVGADGAPVQIAVTQRLRVVGTGDYAFTIPAPAQSVVPGPGSQSMPGLRNTGILWQGFSDRQRTISAIAVLDPAVAAKGLPLRVSIESQGPSANVRLENVATRSIPVLTGVVPLATVLRVLAKMRATSTPTQVAGGPWFFSAKHTHSTKVDVTAPLHVSGTIEHGGTSQPVDVVLGGGRPAATTIAVRGSGKPVLRLRVGLVAPLAVLPTARELARAPQRITALQTAMGEIATAWAFRRYLGSPDPSGDAQAAYVYRTAPPPAMVEARLGVEGSHTLALLLGLFAGLAALVGLAALWARN